MHDEKGFEDLVLMNTSTSALKRFCTLVEWPTHLNSKYPSPEDCPVDALRDYFRWSKGAWGAAEFLAQCGETEIPEWLREACVQLRDLYGAETEVAAESNGDGFSEAAGSVSSDGTNDTQ